MDQTDDQHLSAGRLIDDDVLSYTIGADSLPDFGPENTQIWKPSDSSNGYVKLFPVGTPLGPSLLLFGVEQNIAKLPLNLKGEYKRQSTGRH
jgi:hypothetical protein